MKGEELRIVTCVRRRHYLHHHRRSYRCRRCCYAAAPPLLSTSPASATAPLAASVATATTITADVPCHVDRVHGAAITYALSSVVAVDVADAGRAAGGRWCCCAVWYVMCKMCWCWPGLPCAVSATYLLGTYFSRRNALSLRAVLLSSYNYLRTIPKDLPQAALERDRG